MKSSEELKVGESDFVLDSDWTYRRTGETYRLLYWERTFVLIRKVRDLYGLVGQVVKIPPEQFRDCYTPNQRYNP
jgi:hypothetical protein